MITGGGSGIGFAIACAFLNEGARVIIVGRNEEKLLQAAGRLNSPEKLHWYALDVAKNEAVQDKFGQIIDRFGVLDILINNAGLNIKERTLRQLSVRNWDRIIRTNLDGAFYCTHAVLPHMLKRKDGLIVFISSIAGIRASPLGGAAYAASKFGMSALGICLAAEEKDSGIRSSVIYPGEVDTPILEERPQPISPGQRLEMLQPEDVAAAALFIATLPQRASVPELVIKPSRQMFL